MDHTSREDQRARSNSRLDAGSEWDVDSINGPWLARPRQPPHPRRRPQRAAHHHHASGDGTM